MKNNRGTVLFVSLLLMITLSLLGFAGVMNSLTELNIGKNFRQAREVFYPGDGGLEILGRTVFKAVYHKPYAPTIGGSTLVTLNSIFEDAVFDYNNENVGYVYENNSSPAPATGRLSITTMDNDTTLLNVSRIDQKQVVGRGHCIGSSILFNKGEFCQPFYLTAISSTSNNQARSQIESYFLIRKSSGY